MKAPVLFFVTMVGLSQLISACSSSCDDLKACCVALYKDSNADTSACDQYDNADSDACDSGKDVMAQYAKTANVKLPEECNY